MKKYPSTIMVSFLGLLASLVFGAWWSISLVSAYVKYHPNGAGQSNPACTTTGGNCSAGALIGILVFFSSRISCWIWLVAFAGFYISEMIKNIIHTTISGIYGSFYVIPVAIPKLTIVWLQYTTRRCSSRSIIFIPSLHDLFLRLNLLWESNRLGNPIYQTTRLSGPCSSATRRRHDLPNYFLLFAVSSGAYRGISPIL